ncbi:MAG: hypothetical protein Q9183_006741, partial [Haloplaca sp. 2 TL-2023]
LQQTFSACKPTLPCEQPIYVDTISLTPSPSHLPPKQSPHHRTLISGNYGQMLQASKTRGNEQELAFQASDSRS